MGQLPKDMGVMVAAITVAVTTEDIMAVTTAAITDIMVGIIMDTMGIMASMDGTMGIMGGIISIMTDTGTAGAHGEIIQATTLIPISTTVKQAFRLLIMNMNLMPQLFPQATFLAAAINKITINNEAIRSKPPRYLRALVLRQVAHPAVRATTTHIDKYF
ncbi:unknown protein [Parachlamydia acanthamoebae UV-7]|uniref:Uncharacterized protein n=1 Tax=Parachlamydia acanthamoebae (strain UV7) TaxID=765952 RepID=F8L1K8_PARAV|nr:unknown protein [Parachlamydia acanthamoebae UV-7]